jgi:hypothetical protein
VVGTNDRIEAPVGTHDLVLSHPATPRRLVLSFGSHPVRIVSGWDGGTEPLYWSVSGVGFGETIETATAVFIEEVPCQWDWILRFE